MSSSSSQVDTFWISQKQICYFLFLAVRIKILDQSKTFSEKFISEVTALWFIYCPKDYDFSSSCWPVTGHRLRFCNYNNLQNSACRPPCRSSNPDKRDALWKFIYAYLCYTLLLAIEWHFFTSIFCLCPSRPVCTSHPNFQTFKCRLVVITHMI